MRIGADVGDEFSGRDRKKQIAERVSIASVPITGL